MQGKRYYEEVTELHKNIVTQSYEEEQCVLLNASIYIFLPALTLDQNSLLAL
jgi:hypothetical protein